MALKRQRRALIFQERRNVFEMFGDEQLIKQVTFPQLFKSSKEHLHTKEHHNGLQSSASIMRSTLHDE